MPKPTANIKALTKTDHRKTWQTLKTTHRAAIKAAGLNFDQKFGPALDKYSVAVTAANKSFVAEKIDQKAVAKVVAAAKPLDVIAQSYLTKVKALPNPAGKELTAFLNKIHTDCEGWGQVVDMFTEVEGLPAGSPQTRAVKGLYDPLDKLQSQLNNLVAKLPLVKAQLSDAVRTAQKPTVKSPLTSAQEWTTLQALSQRDWTMLFEAKAATFVNAADTLAGATAAARQDILPLLTAVTNYGEQSDYDSFKTRAKAAMSSSIAPFHNAARDYVALRQDPELNTRLGFGKSLPFIELERTLAAAGTGQKAARLLIDTILDLP